MPTRSLAAAAVLLSAMAGASPAQAGDVVVTIAGSREAGHEVACRLYRGPSGFPFAKGTAGEARTVPGSDGTACIFRGVSPGTYALVAALLPKGQADVTRDLLGRPRQSWGVSNNIRHSLRAPAFQEAAFTVEQGVTTRLRITLAR